MRLVIVLIAAQLTLCPAAEASCAGDVPLDVPLDISSTAVWHFNDGRLSETTVARDGLLDVRYSSRRLGESDPELSVDLVYGGFYVGDLADFLTTPFPVDSQEALVDYVSRKPELAAELNQHLHRYSNRGRIEAIDKLWEQLDPGLEIAYEFAIYEERLVVREPVELEHSRGQHGKLQTNVVELRRYHRDRLISTSTYWFAGNAPCDLVQWGHDMGKEYHLEVLQP